MAASLNGIPGREVSGLLVPGRPFAASGAPQVNAQGNATVTAAGGPFGPLPAVPALFNADPARAVPAFLSPGSPIIGAGNASAASASSVSD